MSLGEALVVARYVRSSCRRSSAVGSRIIALMCIVTHRKIPHHKYNYNNDSTIRLVLYCCYIYANRVDNISPVILQNYILCGICTYLPVFGASVYYPSHDIYLMLYIVRLAASLSI